MGKIQYTPSKCIGCMSCAVYDPAHFKMNDDDGKAELLGAEVSEDLQILETNDDLSVAKSAEESCPTEAFTVEE